MRDSLGRKIEPILLFSFSSMMTKELFLSIVTLCPFCTCFTTKTYQIDWKCWFFGFYRVFTSFFVTKISQKWIFSWSSNRTRRYEWSPFVVPSCSSGNRYTNLGKIIFVHFRKFGSHFDAARFSQCSTKTWLLKMTSLNSFVDSMRVLK